VARHRLSEVIPPQYPTLWQPLLVVCSSHRSPSNSTRGSGSSSEPSVHQAVRDDSARFDRRSRISAISKSCSHSGRKSHRRQVGADLLIDLVVLPLCAANGSQPQWMGNLHFSECGKAGVIVDPAVEDVFAYMAIIRVGGVLIQASSSRRVDPILPMMDLGQQRP